MTSEGDSTDGIEGRSVIEHNGKSTHSEDGIIDLDLSDDLFSVELAEGGELCINEWLLSLRAGMISFSRMWRRLEGPWC